MRVPSSYNPARLPPDEFGSARSSRRAAHARRVAKRAARRAVRRSLSLLS